MLFALPLRAKNGTQRVVLSAGSTIVGDSNTKTFLGEDLSRPSSLPSELYAQCVARILIAQYAHRFICCTNTPICCLHL